VAAFTPDIILLDLQMPEMDGAEALAIIRKSESSKNTPVIILTNLGEEESPKEIRSLGIHRLHRQSRSDAASSRAARQRSPRHKLEVLLTFSVSDNSGGLNDVIK